MKNKILSTITVGSITYGLYQKIQNLKLHNAIEEIDTYVDGIECESMSGLTGIRLAVDDILKQNEILSKENEKLKELIEASKKSLE